MSRKMLINASEPEEIRVAIIEGSILEEFYVERMSVESVLGNIYKGRVTNVEPSIGAAFVDFGGSRHGFLHVSDVLETPLFDAEGRVITRRGTDDEEPAAAEEDDDEEEEAAARRPQLEEIDGEEATGADEGEESDSGDDQDDAAGDDEGTAAGAGAGEGDRDADATEPRAAARGRTSMADGAGGAAGEDAGLRAAEAALARVNGDREEEQEAGTAAATAAEEEEAGGARPARGGSAKGRQTASGASAAKAGRKGSHQERRRAQRPIQEFLNKGQEVVVQVTKDGIGTKGPTLTTYVSLPGRYLVLMPGLDRKGVSRKIDDGKERDRLKKALDQLDVREGLGFIVRTAGVGQSPRALQKDYDYLTRLWGRVEKNAGNTRAPSELYRESDLVIRTIRDIYGSDMGDIIIDDEDVARRAREFLAMVMPKAVARVKLYSGERPLFSAYGIEDEIGRLFMHRVELSSGGSLVVEQTEALVAIDVNSGRFREEDDLEETAYKINIEAAATIARQLRLRDMGGVIVVDFIDMRSEKRRKAVERAFRAALRDDRARIKVARMSPFGVIELTRQRVRPSLRHSIFQRCPTCRGAGYVATPETFELNLVRQIKLHLARNNAGVEVFLNADNAEYFINQKRPALLKLEEAAGKPVMVRIEAELLGDEFRIVPLDGKAAASRQIP